MTSAIQEPSTGQHHQFRKHLLYTQCPIKKPKDDVSKVKIPVIVSAIRISKLLPTCGRKLLKRDTSSNPSRNASPEISKTSYSEPEIKPPSSIDESTFFRTNI